MTWNHRQGGGWSTPTIKARRGGEWVTIGGGGGGGGGVPGGDMSWQDPPTRSTTVNESSYNSIQDALDSISEDTELVLDDGPYTGSALTVGTDNITITGGGSQTTIENGSASTTFETVNDGLVEVDVTSSLSEGDTTVQVSDSSIFSPGDTVLIEDPTQIYRGATMLNTGDDAHAGEYQNIASVNSGELVLTAGIDRDYPNSGSLQASLVEWAVTGVHYDNLDLPGNGTGDSSAYRPFDPQKACKNMWYTNITANDWYRRGVHVERDLNVWMDNVHCDNIGHNGLSVNTYCKNVYIQNSSATNCTHYGLNAGWSQNYANPSKNIYYVDCVGQGDDAGIDQHHGSEDVYWTRCDSNSGDTAHRARALGTYVEGGTWGDSETPYHGFHCTQIPEDVTVDGLELVSSNYAITFESRYGPDFGPFDATDCQFNVNDRLINYRAPDQDDDDNVTITGSFVNCSVNGEWVTDYHVREEPPQSGSSWLTIDITTEYPDNQTPAEYFS